MNAKSVGVEPVPIRLRIRSGPSQHDRLPLKDRCRTHLTILASTAFCLFGACCCRAAGADSAEQPSRIEVLLKTLDPFYKQRVVADGLLIVSSEKVSQHALREVAYLAQKMLANRPDVMEWFGEKRNMYVCVLAYNEMQSGLPECRGQGPWADYRCRGQGGRPISCAEENLLCFKGDPWQGENIFVHEFAHGIHGVLGGMDERFNARLKALYDKATQSGRFRGYAIDGGPGEFWAEGVQAWFDCNGTIRPNRPPFVGAPASARPINASRLNRRESENSKRKGQLRRRVEITSRFPRGTVPNLFFPCP